MKNVNLEKWSWGFIAVSYVLVVGVFVDLSVFFYKMCLGDVEGSIWKLIIFLLIALVALICLLKIVMEIYVKYERDKLFLEHKRKSDREEKQQAYMKMELYAGLLRHFADERFEKEEIKELLREFREYVDEIDKKGKDASAKKSK